MSVDACAELVQRGDPDRFMAAMATPVATRACLFPLYAFNVEVARAPWVTEETMIAEMRLQWWRDALEEIRVGANVRKHEVVTPLSTLLETDQCALLDQLIQARRWDIYRDPFEDAVHFSEYLDATAGHLMWVAARLVGVETDEADIRAVAWAAGLANWFMAIPKLEARGRIPLVDGREAAVQALAQEGLQKLQKAKRIKAAKPALLTAWRAQAILKQARHSPDRVASGALRQSDFSRKISLLWQSF